MSHPSSRAERRHQRARVIARRRFVYQHIWGKRSYAVQDRNNPLDPSFHNGWEPDWGRYAKWNLNCGCMRCHYEKYFKYKRKRREALNIPARNWRETFEE